jgi:hypothetical protein
MYDFHYSPNDRAKLGNFGFSPLKKIAEVQLIPIAPKLCEV